MGSWKVQRSNLAFGFATGNNKRDCFAKFIPKCSEGLAVTGRYALSLVIAWLITMGSAMGAEFRSVIANGTILYDGPSFKATRVYLVSKNYPLEVISRSGEWLKVRDAGGDFSWIAVTSVVEKRTVLIIAPIAEIREAPQQENSAVVFRAEKNVVLDLLEPLTSTWIKVRHRDGQSGYVRLDQVWGL